MNRDMYSKKYVNIPNIHGTDYPEYKIIEYYCNGILFGYRKNECFNGYIKDETSNKFVFRELVKND